MNSYTAYLDESGTHDGAFATVVAGHLASNEQWSVFASEWQKILAHYGLRCFHMVDFAQSRGEFGVGWKENEAKRQALLRELLAAISRYTRFSFVAFSLANEYELANTFFPLVDNGQSAYVLCGLSMIELVGQWKRINLEPDAIVNFIFEHRNEDRGQLLSDATKLGYEKRIAFGHKCPKDRPPIGGLQAADVDAYEFANFFGDAHQWMQSAKEPYDLSPLVRKVRYPLDAAIARAKARGLQSAQVNIASIQRLCQRLSIKQRAEG